MRSEVLLLARCLLPTCALLVAACLGRGVGDVPAAAKLESDEGSGRWASSSPAIEETPAVVVEPAPEVTVRTEAAPSPVVEPASTEEIDAEIQRVGGFDDETVVTLAASAGRLVAAASERMTEEGAPPAVVAFAERMLEDDAQAQAELKLAASAAGVAVSELMEPPHRALHAELEDAPDDVRADLYLVVVEQVQRQVIALYERCSIACDDRDLRALAARRLPTLRAQVASAQRLATTLR